METKQLRKQRFCSFYCSSVLGQCNVTKGGTRCNIRSVFGVKSLICLYNARVQYYGYIVLSSLGSLVSVFMLFVNHRAAPAGSHTWLSVALLGQCVMFLSKFTSPGPRRPRFNLGIVIH